MSNIIRKINSLVMIDAMKNTTPVSVKISPLDSKIDDKKTTITTYYYLVIRSVDLEIQFCNFRNQFFYSNSIQSNIDQQFNVATLQSVINELKMTIEFKKQYPYVMIAIGSIAINSSLSHDVLLTSTIIDLFERNTRGSDFIGLIDSTRLFIMFFNYGQPESASSNAVKIKERLTNIIKLNQYVFDAYHNQSHNLLTIDLFDLEEDGNYDDISKKIL